MHALQEKTAQTIANQYCLSASKPNSYDTLQQQHLAPFICNGPATVPMLWILYIQLSIATPQGVAKCWSLHSNDSITADTQWTGQDFRCHMNRGWIVAPRMEAPSNWLPNTQSDHQDKQQTTLDEDGKIYVIDAFLCNLTEEIQTELAHHGLHLQTTNCPRNNRQVWMKCQEPRVPEKKTWHHCVTHWI